MFRCVSQLICRCAVVLLVAPPRMPAAGGESLDVDGYVEIVLRAHPASAATRALEQAAAAERKAARIMPDPVIELSRARARLAESTAPRGAEKAFSISQSIRWPLAFVAEVRAADRKAESLTAEGEEAQWELVIAARRAYAAALYARSLVDISRAVEKDARALKDLTDRRAELGESREAERIKATVEWLRRRRDLGAAERDAQAAENIMRALAVEPLPRPLDLNGELPRPTAHLDPDVLRQRLMAENPRLRSARARAEQQQGLLSAARRGRIRDIEFAFYRTEELDKTSNGFAIGLTLPLWNANRGEVAQAAAEAARAEAMAEQAEVDLIAELEARLRDLDVAAGEAEILNREIMPAATRSLEIVRFSYEEGETSMLDLLDAQRTYSETQREAVESSYALAIAVSDIQRLVGPDFDPWR